MKGQSITVILVSLCVGTAFAEGDRKQEYVTAVTRGAGLLPWQEAGPSPAEQSFRQSVEERKASLLSHARDVQHPVLYTEEDLARARANAESNSAARGWVNQHLTLADYALEQGSEWIDSMIPAESPAHGYGFTCPKCVGDKSQEGVGDSLIKWSYREPDVFECRACGQRYPDPAFPETAELIMPRMGHRISYYLNDAERAQPEDKTGALAWHWVGYPIHVSFSGIIREEKVGFMRDLSKSLALAYAFTGDVRYAEKTRELLLRYAACYRNWLYRDYWDTYADCDPLYAAWHDTELPLEWKRHLSESAYKNDTFEKASMLQTYWGAGRVHPSTDAVSALVSLVLAYDLTCEALRPDGAPVWTLEDKTAVERDLILEYIIGAEPFVGGAGNADNANNKSPRIYNAMAAVAKCLGIPSMAETALRGYERVRDDSFNYDGFSVESPSYNNMYLSQLLLIPETLHGFSWPADFTSRTGTVDYYASDPRLRLMYRGILWSLTPSGHYLPLSDTHVHTTPTMNLAHMGLKRYPDLYAGAMPRLEAAKMSEYALFNLSQQDFDADTGIELPETYFPAWQTAILRQGSLPGAATATLSLNPPGGHRHRDNLALYYEAGGRAAVGDLGYVGDMPVNTWIRSTQSHCLVVVDDEDQRFDERKPELIMMATSPLASVVDARSDTYAQCSDYRRRVVLVKASEGHSFLVDIFTVSGGKTHAFRSYSEIASSDSVDGHLTFDGLDMPAEAPLPNVGASLERDDIYGLRDDRTATSPPPQWTATWQDGENAYRLWMLSPCDRVEAANGPGQRTLEEAGRRVRYINAIRTGDPATSRFVAIHEPRQGGEWFIQSARMLDATHAGDGAIAIRIDTIAGTYYVLGGFENAIAVDGLEFQGEFATLRMDDRGPLEYFCVASSLLRFGSDGFSDNLASITGAARRSESGKIVAGTPPALWPEIEGDVQAYVRVATQTGWTAFPIDHVTAASIAVRDYPLPDVTEFELQSVRYKALR